MKLSYKEEKILSKLVWLAIENGNSATAKAFEPTPEEYEMLQDIANKIDKRLDEEYEKRRRDNKMAIAKMF